MKGIILLLAIFAVTAAMVPMDRRAVNPDSEEAQTEATTEKEKNICAFHTPCAWSIYKPILKIIEMNITNTYCECGAGTYCQNNEDDSSINAYVHRCRPLDEKPEELES